MRSDIGVEAVKGAPEIDLLDQSLLDQDVQVAIDRAHAQVGKLPLQLIVDPVGGGMYSRVLQQLENPFPLLASLSFSGKGSSAHRISSSPCCCLLDDCFSLTHRKPHFLILLDGSMPDSEDNCLLFRADFYVRH